MAYSYSKGRYRCAGPLALYGRHIIQQHHATLFKQLPVSASDYSVPDLSGGSDEGLKVGIIGAGIGGLYTALILSSLGIDYEILEASDRAGGRLETFRFPNGQKYDYYEAGAMRFPLPKKNDDGTYKDGIMRRLGELIEYPPLNQGPNPLNRTLIPYYLYARKGASRGFRYFNRAHEPVSADPDKPIGTFNGEEIGVHEDYIAAGADALNRDILSPFSKMLIKDLVNGGTRGLELLMENNSYSQRSYMGSKYMPSENLNLPPQHLPTSVIDWCELLGSSSGGFNRALAEQVFYSLEFASVTGTDFGNVDWICFEGGTETLSKKIVEHIHSTGVGIQFKQRVTSIGQDYIDSGSQLPYIRVTINGTDTKKYSHVISTLPLPVLRTIDLTDAGLSIPQRNSLRALTYGPATKIAILFKSNWWTTKLGIVGGQSFTDLPIHTIVYPSYGVDSATPCKVLIASYTWTGDADRLAALAAGEQREALKELVLRNLAEAHNHRSADITYEYLKGEFVDMNVKNWTQDPYTMGAYAFFEPGQFENLYASLNAPAANDRLHFAGEAVSTRHGWVVGALDSAWRAVYEYLTVAEMYDKIQAFKNLWGENVEWTDDSIRTKDAPYGAKHDLLSEHIRLVHKAIQGGIIKMSKVAGPGVTGASAVLGAA